MVSLNFVTICSCNDLSLIQRNPDSKILGANVAPIWSRQDPGGPNVGPMNFAICGVITWALARRQFVAKSLTDPIMNYNNKRHLEHTSVKFESKHNVHMVIWYFSAWQNILMLLKKTCRYIIFGATVQICNQQRIVRNWCLITTVTSPRRCGVPNHRHPVSTGCSTPCSG